MKTTTSVNFQQELLKAVEKDAERQFRSKSSVINEIVAKHYGIVLSGGNEGKKKVAEEEVSDEEVMRKCSRNM